MVLVDANSNLEQSMLGTCHTVSCMVKERLHSGIQVSYRVGSRVGIPDGEIENSRKSIFEIRIRNPNHR